MTINDSALVRLADQAQRPTRWWVAWLTVVLVAIFGVQLLWAVPMGMLGIVAGTVPAQLMELLIAATTIAVVAVWVVVKERRRFATIGLTGKGGWKQLLVGLPVGMVMFMIPTFALVVMGQYRFVAPGSGQTAGMAALPIVIALVLVWIVQASAEEILMRGYLVQTHARQLPGWLAILIPAVGFAVVHFGAGPIALLNIALVAVFFTFISLRQGSIWLACGIHAGWNYMQGNVLGIPVSGTGRSTAMVFMMPTPGSPDWLTGGGFGIEESLSATVLLAALVAVSWWWFRTAPAPSGRGSAPAPTEAGTSAGSAS
jgi:membrane protease YdiL (CAAX protease family)